MIPKYFSLGELQQVYEVILGGKLLDLSFRRIIADKVEKTDKMKTVKEHRQQYCSNIRRLMIMIKNDVKKLKKIYNMVLRWVYYV